LVANWMYRNVALWLRWSGSMSLTRSAILSYMDWCTANLSFSNLIIYGGRRFPPRKTNIKERTSPWTLHGTHTWPVEQECHEALPVPTP